MLGTQFNAERTAAAQKPGATMRGAEVSAKHMPPIQDLAPASAATEQLPPNLRPNAANEKQPPKQPDAAPSTPAPPPETAGEKAPSKVAKAEPPPLPLSEPSALLSAGLTFKDCDFCPSLVVVPKGEFTMGSNEHPHEKPAHKVRISSPFAIGQYEVTVEEWDRCVDAGACRYRPVHRGSPKEPAGNLSWDDANAYLKWLSQKTGQTPPAERGRMGICGPRGLRKAVLVGRRSGLGQSQLQRLRVGDRSAVRRRRHLQAQSLWSLRYGREHGGVGPGLLDKILSGRARGRFGMGEGQLQPARFAGRLSGNKFTYIRSSARFRYDSDVRYEANGFRVLRELR